MTVCRVVAHNERADLFRAGLFTDTTAREVEGIHNLLYFVRQFRCR
jgi:hypothetical protein